VRGICRRSALLAALLAAVALGGVHGRASAHEHATPAQVQSIVRNVVPLAVGDVVPDTVFIDEKGRAFRFSALRGKTVVLAFMYTRCPDPSECPLISAHYQVLQRLIGNGPYALVEVTLDPEFDTPARLAAYAQTFAADTRKWTLVTGTSDAVYDFAARFEVSRFDDPQRGIIHNDRTVILDPQGRINTFIDETGWSPNDVYAQMRSVMEQPSNPIARLDLWLSKGFVAICGNGVAGSSGLLDLIITFAVLGVFGWAFYRLTRLFFANSG